MLGSCLLVAMVLEAFWMCLGCLLGRFWGLFWGLEKRDKKRAQFRSGSRPSWSRPGGDLEPSWRHLGASWRFLRASLARFFVSWKPYRVPDLFSNELEPFWTSFLKDL